VGLFQAVQDGGAADIRSVCILIVMCAPNTAYELISDMLVWLQRTYNEHGFHTERDLVWTFQRRLSDQIRRSGLHFCVQSDFPMIKGPRRAQCADLALLSIEQAATSGRTAQEIVSHIARPLPFVAEFKYEPDHTRATGAPPEIWPTKLDPSKVFWNEPTGSVLVDVDRSRRYVQAGLAELAVSVFIDEGGHFRNKAAPAGAAWEDWPGCGPSGRCAALIAWFRGCGQ
jgi:hypothetical protein